MIPDEIISQIRERTDIVALVQEYVPLKRSGASFKGVCPFHSEKTPSFYVHPARQFFHCFGCQTSGDSLSFLMKIEGRPFPEVIRTLAERAGVELPVLDSREEAAYRRARAHEERLAAVVDAAAGFYVRQLHEHPLGRMATEELERRGIGSDATASFRLGYAPHGWDGLARWLRENDWPLADAEEVGLIVPRRSGDGHYDRFRHRLLFPIADQQGRIVAFSGRVLPPPPGEPQDERGEGAKYVNSPEGPLYKKGEILFGLHEGRVAVRREGWCVLCEGNFDLVALHQAGFENAAAPMGTALTESQCKLVRRLCERVVLLFDGDAAGRKAARASWPVLHAAGLSARVVVLPPGDDPDSFLRTHGSNALRHLMDAAPSMLEFLIDDAAAESAGDAHQKAQAIESLGPVLAAVDNPVEVRLYVERVARKFGVQDLDAVRQQLRRGVRASRSGGRRAGTQVRENTSQQPEPPRRRPLELPPLEGELLTAMMDNPELFAGEEAKNLEKLLTSLELRAIFHTAARMVESRGVVDAAALLAECADNAAFSWLEERLAIQKYDLDAARQALRDGVPRLAKQNVERELPRLAAQIHAARRAGDEERALELTRQRDQLGASALRLMAKR